MFTGNIVVLHHVKAGPFPSCVCHDRFLVIISFKVMNLILNSNAIDGSDLMIISRAARSN